MGEGDYIVRRIENIARGFFRWILNSLFGQRIGLVRRITVWAILVFLIIVLILK